MIEDKLLYECDPDKNVECKKRGCQNPCHRTSHKEYAKDGAAGRTSKEWMKIDHAKR